MRFLPTANPFLLLGVIVLCLCLGVSAQDDEPRLPFSQLHQYCSRLNGTVSLASLARASAR